MKCTSRCLIIITLLALCLTGCGKKSFDMAYDPNYPVSTFRVVNVDNSSVGNSFAQNLCVTDMDVSNPNGQAIEDVGAAGLFCLDDSSVLYAKNIHERLYPASLTKILTAYVALKHGNLEDIVVASENAHIEDASAQKLPNGGLKEGDRMTLNQALHLLLLYSANDVAIMIAENVGGSVEGFCDLMNQEAVLLGATNSHFVNPNGLSDENHYSSAYDLYLIFQAVIQNETFREIIAMTSYSTVYMDKNGDSVSVEVNSTNQYISKNYSAPDNITVIGGKTGTTTAAGNCLILLCKDSAGKQYVSVILKATQRDYLYQKMNQLLSGI